MTSPSSPGCSASQYSPASWQNRRPHANAGSPVLVLDSPVVPVEPVEPVVPVESVEPVEPVESLVEVVVVIDSSPVVGERVVGASLSYGSPVLSDTLKPIDLLCTTKPSAMK